MNGCAAQRAFVRLLFLSCIVVSCTAFSQVMSIPSSGFGNIGTPGISGSPIGLGLIDSMSMTNNLFTMTTNAQNNSNQSPSASVSKLDLKAPWKARREYDKGYQLLMRKDFQNAVLHLSSATSMYPSFVAAHNALGSAYLNLGQNDRARDEFAQSVALDDHLPNSHLNLGCAELALGHYAAAEDSMQKASAIAPLDLQLLTSRAYGEFMNHDYPAVVATAQQVHERKHKGAAIVHYFAAGALDAQGKFADEETELNAIIQEEPTSTAATQARQLLDQIKVEQARRAEAKLHPAEPVVFTTVAPTAPTPEESARHARSVLQDLKEKQQIAEAEPEPNCTADCGDVHPPASTTDAKLAPGPTLPSKGSSAKSSLHTLRSSVDEVALFFTATDHGKSVLGLTGADIAIQDDRKPPSAIIGFRNESQLPLRLGLVIDTSESISTRFSFEQHAAINFLQKAVTDQNDLAFVVGVANSVLVVQDFTNDQKKISHAIDQLAPSGGTALWDAVGFAADKLASHQEEHPVAKILVVISDGEDNSSNIALKDAIKRAQHGEVAVYTVSTRDYEQEEASALLGDHALKTLAELTGGAAFTPGSIHRLNGSLGDLQQVLRGRYLISYKPALFQRDGRYRTIDITAQKDGHKLRVYARRGYYASVNSPPPDGAAPGHDATDHN
jgi:VWFA-related protein